MHNETQYGKKVKSSLGFRQFLQFFDRTVGLLSVFQFTENILARVRISHWQQ